MILGPEDSQPGSIPQTARTGAFVMEDLRIRDEHGWMLGMLVVRYQFDTSVFELATTSHIVLNDGRQHTSLLNRPDGK